MATSKPKSIGGFIAVTVLCLAIGTAAWEILERLFQNFGMTVDLTAGPFGLDLFFFAFSVRLNPGSLFGFVGGILVYKFV